MWLIGLFKKLGIDAELPMPIYNDSTYTIQIEANPVFDEHTKHTHTYIYCYFIREKIQLSLIQPIYLNTSEQPINLLTNRLIIQHAYLAN